MRSMSTGVVGARAHITTVNSYHYNFSSVHGHISPAILWMLSNGSVDHRYLSLHVFGCFVTIEDDYVLLSKIREWGCVIHLSMDRANSLSVGWIDHPTTTLIICFCTMDRWINV